MRQGCGWGDRAVVRRFPDAPFIGKVALISPAGIAVRVSSPACRIGVWAAWLPQTSWGIVAHIMETPPSRIGILTVSDRASRGAYVDEGGPAIREYLHEVLASAWEPREQIVPDDLESISAAIVALADAGCCLVVTTGGTGPAPRDVTPEATERVCQKMLPGFGELMRAESLKYVPTAILSRQTAGICGRALVVNLPGRPRSIRQCLDAVFPAIPYCIDLIHTGAADGPRLETKPERLVAFRPKG